MPRERLPSNRTGITHKFSVGGVKGYLTLNYFPDGKPGELFITMSRDGSTMGGLMECLSLAVSLGLQHGIPLAKFCEHFTGQRFEPSGVTSDPSIPIADSLIDYIFRWLAQFIPKDK